MINSKTCRFCAVASHVIVNSKIVAFTMPTYMYIDMPMTLIIKSSDGFHSHGNFSWLQLLYLIPVIKY